MRQPPRPRDALGRPLPRDGRIVEPDPEPLPPAQTLTLAQQLLDGGRAFRAHEVLEARWKATAGVDRDLWRGLAQLAVGVTHAQRGNAHGAVALLRRAAQTLTLWEGQRPDGIAVADVRRWANATADAVEAGGTTAVGTPPRLTGSGG